LNVWYRAHQFFQALTARPSPEDLEKVENVLSPALLKLFFQLQASEQSHSIEVFQKLREENEKNDDLLVAALLHDIGKSCHPLSLWERIIIVLGKTMFPEKVSEWGRAEISGWKRPFVVAEQHAEWGAEMAKNAGASEMTVMLIRRHQDQIKDTLAEKLSLEEELLYRLQIMDNES
jgi:putative nucleotidyltransferase with HDIG domain